MRVPDLSLRVTLAHDLSHLPIQVNFLAFIVQNSCLVLLGPDLQISQVLEDTCNHLEARSNTVVHHRSHYHSVSPASGSISMSYSGSMM